MLEFLDVYEKNVKNTYVKKQDMGEMFQVIRDEQEKKDYDEDALIEKITNKILSKLSDKEQEVQETLGGESGEH